MSGGHFNYAYSLVADFSEHLALLICKRNTPNEYKETPYSYKPDTIEILSEIQEASSKMAKLMREVEWLYSGYAGEEYFKKAVLDIMGE